MYSIRRQQRKTKNEKRKTVGLSGLPFFVLPFSIFVCIAGCQGISHEQPPAPVNDAPLVVDEAMQIRDWDRSTNYYANGGTVAGGTGYLSQTHEAVNPGHRRFVEAPVAALNIATMPVGLFVNSPWEAQVYRGEAVTPTYTGQPPLPGQPRTPTEARPALIDTPAPQTGEAPMTPPPPAPPVIETPPPPADAVTPAPPAPAPVVPTTPAPSPADPFTPAPPSDVAPPAAPTAPTAPPAVEPAPPAVEPAPPAAPPAAS